MMNEMKKKKIGVGLMVDLRSWSVLLLRSISIPFAANFGGQVHTDLCSDLERAPQIDGRIGPLELVNP